MMKSRYANLDEILEVFEEFNEIQFKFRGHDYDISKIKYNFYDKNNAQTSFWKLPCYMAIKSEEEDTRWGSHQPLFRLDYAANKTYESWIELLQEYKIDGISSKDVLCSEEVDIYWWDY